MYRRGAEVDLRYGLRILEGISNHRRSCRVLRPVQEQCQQCIVSQTYPSARKAEEKSILQLRLLPENHPEVLAQVIAIHFNYTSYFTQQRSHSFRGGFKPYKYDVWSPFTGGFVPRAGREKFSKERAEEPLVRHHYPVDVCPVTNFILYSKMVYSASLRLAVCRISLLGIPKMWEQE